jgi:surfeit locus 1 family protein
MTRGIGASVTGRFRIARRVVPTLAAAAVVALTVSLGNWQSRRAAEKDGLQRQHEARERESPLAMPAQPADAAVLDGRRVVVRGRFVPQATVFIDNRTYKGVAGLHVVTPVKIEGSDLHVAVLRGWVARDARDRSVLPRVATPEASVELEGVAQARLDGALELRASAPPGPRDRVWQNFDLDRYAAWAGLAMQPLVVRQAARPPLDDALVRDWPLAGSGADKHRGYALQWYLMAAVTAGLWLYFVVLRRRDDAEHSS